MTSTQDTGYGRKSRSQSLWADVRRKSSQSSWADTGRKSRSASLWYQITDDLDTKGNFDAEGGFGVARSTPLDRREIGILQKEAMQEKKDKERDERKAMEHKNKIREEHTLLYAMLRRHSHRWQTVVYRWIVRTLIAVTIVNWLLESAMYFKTCCTPYFNRCEAFIATFFMLEYFIKIKTAPERSTNQEEPGDVDAFKARMKYVFSSEAFWDVLSFLPFFVCVAVGLNPAANEGVRILRLFRLFKIPFVWESFRLVGRVLHYNQRVLFSSFLVCGIMMLTGAIALYYTRPAVDTRDNFSSILACLYISILMLTGQGIPNGDMPWYTRIVVALISLFAIAQFAIPASMLTWGFEQEAERNIVKHRAREKKIAHNIRKGKKLDESSSSSGESDRQEEWDGYLEQVCGSDSDSDSNKSGSAKPVDDSPKAAASKLLLLGQLQHALTASELRRVKRIFVKLDEDNDGIFSVDKVRLLTATDQEAQDLIKSIQDFADGDEVTERHFIQWLSDIKTTYTRYGDKIFLRLLNQMESMLQAKREVTIATWKRAANAIKLGLTGRPTAEASQAPAPAAASLSPAAAATAQGLPAPAVAQLECTVKDLREEIASLEEEIAALSKA